MKTFKALGISAPILKTIQEKGFENPTKIQEQSIPIILQGKDIIAGSKTGSGKTLAFSTAVIDRSSRGLGVQALIMAPTRELALQVTAAIKEFSKYKELNVTCIYGGVSINPQFRELESADIVVGTPGRLLDHLERGTLDPSTINIVVLDEADKMFDMGFMDDVTRILDACSNRTQTLLYSATISTDLAKLSKKYMNNPEKISIEHYVDTSKLEQLYYNVDQQQKFSLLVHILKHEQLQSVMVFCNTQRVTDAVAKNLNDQGFDAIPIHGGLSQAKRTRTMGTFKRGKVTVLVCTDVAARGLHVEDVSHVINYDIPNDSKQYIHRIGRTARAGSSGKAINLLTQRDYENFDRVLSDHTIAIERKETPQVEKVFFKISQKSRNFSWRGGPRRSEHQRARGNRRPRRSYN